MVNDPVEILLVEDNPNDVELTLRALKRQNLANKVCVVKDGAEALEFLFATGAYAGRNVKNPPRVVFLDLKLPRVDGLERLHQLLFGNSKPLLRILGVVKARLQYQHSLP